MEKSMLKVLEDFLNHRKEFRRLLLLVTWLELLRERDLWMLRDEIDGLEGGYDMWPSTCQQEGVPALDPDHPFHTRRPLAPVDERQDFLLLERIWRFLRAGRLDDAVDLCQRCGQDWRAASISGGDPWEVYVPGKESSTHPPSHPPIHSFIHSFIHPPTGRPAARSNRLLLTHPNTYLPQTINKEEEEKEPLSG